MEETESLASGLEYEDYVALVCQFDNQLPLRSKTRIMPPPYPPDYMTGRRFSSRCRAYRREYEDYCKAFSGEGRNPIPEEFFYRPKNYTVLSNYAETMSVMALSNLDAAGALSSRHDLPVRNSSLAFLPRLECLAYGDEIPSFLTTLENSLQNSDGDGPGLLAFVNFRLSPFAILGPSLFYQRATLRAISDRIQSLLTDLKNEIESDGNCVAGRFISLEQVESTKCVLLDTQDWAELSLLIITDNFSISSLITSSISSLKQCDVYAAHDAFRRENSSLPCLRDLAGDFELSPHTSFENLYRAIDGIKSEQLSRGLGVGPMNESHIVLAPHTTLGVSHDHYAEISTSEEHHSYINPRLRFHFSQGHRSEIETKLSEVKRPAWTSADKRRLKDIGRFYANEIGHEDFADTLLPANRDPHPENPMFGREEYLISLSSCLAYMRNLAETFFGEDQKTHHVTKFSLWLEIPVPEIFGDIGNSGKSDISYLRPKLAGVSEQDRTHVPSIRILRHLSKMLFGLSQPVKLMGDTSLEFNALGSDCNAPLSIPALRSRMRKLGVPSPLSKALLLLYSDYAKAISDSFLMPVVLDLYDSFLGVSKLFQEKEKIYERNLTEFSDRFDVPSGGLFDVPKLLSMRPPAFEESELKSLVSLVHSLEESLHQRTRNSLRNLDSSHSALDVRGKWSQLISSADAVVKTGLGLVRNVMSEDGCEMFQPDGWLSAASLIAPTSRPQLVSHYFGDQHDSVGNRFSYSAIRINEEHLLRPRFLADYIHETGHILLRWFLSECEGSDLTIVDAIRSDETLGELLPELVVYQLLFAEMTDEESAKSRYSWMRLTNFWVSNGGVTWDDKVYLNKVLEVIIRTFLVTEGRMCFQELSKSSRETIIDEAIESFENDFIPKMVNPVLLNFADVWTHGNLSEVVTRSLRSQLNEMFEAILWSRRRLEKVTEILRRFRPASVDAVRRSKELCDGPQVPLARYRLHGNELGRDSYFDPLYLVCISLNSWCEMMLKDFEKNWLFLLRDPDNGKPYVPPFVDEKGKPNPVFSYCDEGKWVPKNIAPILVDRTKGGAFCVNDSIGRNLVLQLAIGMMKTFYDVSCNLRSRRLHSIIDSYIYESVQGILRWTGFFEKMAHELSMDSGRISKCANKAEEFFERLGSRSEPFGRRGNDGAEIEASMVFEERRAEWEGVNQTYIELCAEFRSINQTYLVESTLFVVSNLTGIPCCGDIDIDGLRKELDEMEVVDSRTRIRQILRITLEEKLELLEEEAEKVSGEQDAIHSLRNLRDLLVDPDWQ